MCRGLVNNAGWRPHLTRMNPEIRAPGRDSAETLMICQNFVLLLKHLPSYAPTLPLRDPAVT